MAFGTTPPCRHLPIQRESAKSPRSRAWIGVPGLSKDGTQ